jgi:hypothetical protein
MPDSGNTVTTNLPANSYYSAVTSTTGATPTAITATSAYRSSNPWEERSTVTVGDSQVVNIGDFTITGRAIKACIKVMLPIAMEEYPEDFV